MSQVSRLVEDWALLADLAIEISLEHEVAGEEEVVSVVAGLEREDPLWDVYQFEPIETPLTWTTLRHQNPFINALLLPLNQKILKVHLPVHVRQHLHLPLQLSLRHEFHDCPKNARWSARRAESIREDALLWRHAEYGSQVLVAEADHAVQH